MNTKRFYWPAQFLGWIGYCSLPTLYVYNRSPEQINGPFVFIISVIIVSGIMVTHLQRLMFIRLGWLDLRLPKLLPRVIISSVICSTLISVIQHINERYAGLVDETEFFVLTDIILNILAGFLLIFSWNAIYFTLHFFQRSRFHEITNLELKASNRESELNNLRSQLNPHFLFNSLNSIRALVDIEPNKAKMSVTTLSNLLRSSLDLGKRSLVSLEKELVLVKGYLELEKIRFEERLKVDWQLAPGLEQFEIPPFTLQMLIENAIKHGISNLIDGGFIEILAYEDDSFVILEVRNSGTLAVLSDLGVGIQNVKKRLNLQYGDGATFNLSEKDNKVVAQIKFKK